MRARREASLLSYLLHMLGGLAAAYLTICVLAFIFQGRLVYFPDPRLIADPGHLGLAYDEVRFISQDGVELHGWFIPHPAARATVLFCHGNAGNISHRLMTIRCLHQLRVNLLIFDYRGFGQSGGRPTEAGTYADIAAAWRHLVVERGLEPRTIVLFGRSLGGAVAAELATHEQPAGLILESTFTTLPDLGAVVYPWLPVRYLARLRYDARDHVTRASCPKLIIHSSDDEIVPFSMGRALLAAAAPPKRFLTMHGDHNQGFVETGEAYLAGLDDFLTSVQGLAGDPPQVPKDD